MPDAQEILRILGPAGGLLVLAQTVAIVALWNRLMLVYQQMADHNILRTQQTTMLQAAVEELRKDVSHGFERVMDGLEQ